MSRYHEASGMLPGGWLRLECLCADDFGAGYKDEDDLTEEDRDHLEEYERVRSAQHGAAAAAARRGIDHSLSDSDDRDSRHSDLYLYFPAGRIAEVESILGAAGLSGDVLDVPSGRAPARVPPGWTVEEHDAPDWHGASRRAAVEAWHGTPHTGFAEFDRAFARGQLGFHFGTEAQARDVLGEGEGPRGSYARSWTSGTRCVCRTSAAGRAPRRRPRSSGRSGRGYRAGGRTRPSSGRCARRGTTGSCTRTGSRARATPTSCSTRPR